MAWLLLGPRSVAAIMYNWLVILALLGVISSDILTSATRQADEDRQERGATGEQHQPPPPCTRETSRFFGLLSLPKVSSQCEAESTVGSCFSNEACQVIAWLKIDGTAPRAHVSGYSMVCAAVQPSRATSYLFKVATDTEDGVHYGRIEATQPVKKLCGGSRQGETFIKQQCLQNWCHLFRATACKSARDPHCAIFAGLVNQSLSIKYSDPIWRQAAWLEEQLEKESTKMQASWDKYQSADNISVRDEACDEVMGSLAASDKAGGVMSQSSTVGSPVVRKPYIRASLKAVDRTVKVFLSATSALTMGMTTVATVATNFIIKAWTKQMEDSLKRANFLYEGVVPFCNQVNCMLAATRPSGMPRATLPVNLPLYDEYLGDMFCPVCPSWTVPFPEHVRAAAAKIENACSIVAPMIDEHLLKKDGKLIRKASRLKKDARRICFAEYGVAKSFSQSANAFTDAVKEAFRIGNISEGLNSSHVAADSAHAKAESLAEQALEKAHAYCESH